MASNLESPGTIRSPASLNSRSLPLLPERLDVVLTESDDILVAATDYSFESRRSVTGPSPVPISSTSVAGPSLALPTASTIPAVKVSCRWLCLS